MASRKITQESFDEVVKENMEEFGMSPAEAVEDAVSQFEAQGVDLDGIVKSATDSSESPVVVAVNRLKSSCEDGEGLTDALEALCQLLEDRPSRVLAGSHGAVEAVVLAGQGGADEDLVNSLVCVESLCKDCVENSDRLTGSGMEWLLGLCKSNGSDGRMRVLLGKALGNALLKNEENRQCLEATDFPKVISDLLAESLADGAALGFTQLCTVARIFTFDDDMRKDFSHAHDHARMLVEEGILKTLVEALKPASLAKDGVELSVVLLTLAKLLVKDEFCVEVGEAGVLELLSASVSSCIESAKCAGRMCMLVKALAGNEDLRKQIGGEQIFEDVVRCLLAYPSDASVAEGACSAISSLCLRSTANAERFMGIHGGHEAVLQMLTVHKGNKRVVRYACNAIRNIVSRSRHLNNVLLEAGAEAPLRAVYDTDPACTDYAKAALRDLGCEITFRESWTGKGGTLLQQ